MRPASAGLRTLPLLLAAGCGVGPTGPDPAAAAPTGVRAEYEWKLEGWHGDDPVGDPTVVLSWERPSGAEGDPYRVYGRRQGAGSYILIATVTSCGAERCFYADANVQPGTTYEYFVARELRDGREVASGIVDAAVPPAGGPGRPAVEEVVPLDGVLYLRLPGPPGDVRRYVVYLVALDGEEEFYQVGETDGTGFLDERTENGVRHEYQVTAVDFDGHHSRLSPRVSAVPRPDRRGELILAHGADPDRSGFRFHAPGGDDPIVPGDGPDAQWRLEVEDGAFRIRPRSGTGLQEWGRTSGLSCGPGAEAGCVALRRAPEGGYGDEPLTVRPEFSYAFRLDGVAGTNFGEVRVSHLGADQHGRELMVFDWAYQTVPGLRDLGFEPGAGWP